MTVTQTLNASVKKLTYIQKEKRNTEEKYIDVIIEKILGSDALEIYNKLMKRHFFKEKKKR